MSRRLTPEQRKRAIKDAATWDAAQRGDLMLVANDEGHLEPKLDVDLEAATTDPEEPFPSIDDEPDDADAGLIERNRRRMSELRRRRDPANWDLVELFAADRVFRFALLVVAAGFVVVVLRGTGVISYSLALVIAIAVRLGWGLVEARR